MTEMGLLLERLERLAIVLDELMPRCAELVRDAIALLKEKEAVEPNVIIDTLVCGNCGTRLERQSMVGDNILVTERFEYCPICGRKVKWE